MSKTGCRKNINGRVRTYEYPNGDRLHKIVVWVKGSETVHPVTVGNVEVPYVEPGYVREYERVKVNRSQTAARWLVYDRKVNRKPVTVQALEPKLEPKYPPDGIPEKRAWAASDPNKTGA